MTRAFFRRSWNVATSSRGMRSLILGRSRAYTISICHFSGRSSESCENRSRCDVTNWSVDISAVYVQAKISLKTLKLGLCGAKASWIACVASWNVVTVLLMPFHHVLASPVSRSGKPVRASASVIFLTDLKILMAVRNSVTATCARVPSKRAVHWVKCLCLG